MNSRPAPELAHLAAEMSRPVVATLPGVTLAPPAASRSIDGEALASLDLADPQYLTRPWIVEGVTLVVGRPKIGKTTLLRQLCHAANAGGSFLSSPVAAGDVTFLSLEEGERLMRAKLRAMGVAPAEFRGIRFEFDWPQAALGAEKLRERFAATPAHGQRLVVVDSLQRFRAMPDRTLPAYAQDYEAVKVLAELAKDVPGLAVLVLHHTTKAQPDDPVAAISGTYGLTAAADNYLILLRQGEAFRLHCGGRCWEGDSTDYELEQVKPARWALVGEWHGADARVTPKQRQVLTQLQSGAKTRAEIAQALGVDDPTKVSHLLRGLQDKGLVEPIANGWCLTRSRGSG
jgi:RecA-family ATPase